MILKRLVLIGAVITFASQCSKDDDAAAATNFTLTGAGSGSGLTTTTTPTVAKMGVYKFAISENTDCSSPVTVLDNGDTAVDFDMLQSPTLGTGTVADGTYPCVIMVIKPSITVAAGATDGACTAGVEFSQNVCGGQGSDGATVDLDGELQTCGTDTDKAYLYLSTASLLTTAYEEDEANCTGRSQGDDRDCNSWEPPTAATSLERGVPLGSALVVAGSQVGVFSMSDLSTSSRDGACDMARPSFTFTTGS